MATQVSGARASVAMGGHAVSAARHVFTSRVTAADARPVLAPAKANSSAWGSVRIVVNDDDSFEYLVTIYNPQGETFTSGYLRRQGEENGGAVLATLFSDLTLRSQYIQLRGTISVARDARAAVLAEELRENPRAFAITLHTPSSPQGGAIRGTVE